MAASTTPTSSKWTFLMHKASAAQSFTKLVDIKDYSDLGGEREMLETTTLTDDMQHFIPGIIMLDNGNVQFNCNYILSDYKKLKALEEKDEQYAVWLGGTKSADGTVTPNGEDGKFLISGLLSVRIVGKGVNEVREMQVSIAPTKDITLDEED